MIVSIDIETACAVEGCKHKGKAMCPEGHSLSPWHSEITVIGLVTGDGRKKVFRGPDKIKNLQAVLEVLDEPEIGGQAFKFDLLHLTQKGLDFPLTRWAWDTQLMGYVLTEKIPDSYIEGLKARAPAGQHRFGKHSLKTLAPYFLGVEPFWEVEDKDDDEYVLKDAEYTLRLYSVLKQKLEERGEFEFYNSKLLQWTKMLLAAEMRGVQIDMEALTQMEQELTQKAKDLKAKLDMMWAPAHDAYVKAEQWLLVERYKAMANRQGKMLQESPRHIKLLEAAETKLPIGVDYDSPKQMLWLLRDYLGYSCTSFEGKETTGREVLERLASEGKEDVATYLEWRKTNKILSAFLPTYRELAVPSPDGTHRVHAVYNPTSTRTGRTSCERPNLQQVGPDLKHLFIPDSGFKFVGFDLGQIESRLIALYTNDRNLNHITKNGISIHDFSAKEFLGLPCEVNEVKSKFPNERSATKNCIFALFFNAGPNRIRITFANKGIHLDQSDCRSIHAKFKSTYPDAYQYGQQLVTYFEQGGVLPNLLGRPLQIENPEDAFMTSLNLVVQSSASDLLLEWAHRSQSRFDKEGIEGRFVLFVHDYAGALVRESHALRAKEIIEEELEGFVLENSFGRLPLEAEGGVSDSWAK